MHEFEFFHSQFKRIIELNFFFEKLAYSIFFFFFIRDCLNFQIYEIITTIYLLKNIVLLSNIRILTDPSMFE